MQYSIQQSSAALPAGYEVKKEGFQKHALYFEGELLAVYQFSGWASNAAIRHSHK